MAADALAADEHGRQALDEVEKDGAELLNDIPLQIAVELGRVSASAEEVVAMKVGDVLDLNRLSGEPVDLSVNGKVVARGEVVIVGGNFALLVTSVAEPQLRLESIRCLF